jgi:single-strand DNA-binding protein
VARSLNKATIIGNLGADPEVRSTSGGTRVASFSVATSRSWTSREGGQQEKTEWHRIVAWAKLADVVERYLKKGDRVYVEGEIQYRQYEDKDGVTKYMTEINAREMIMLGGVKEMAVGAPAPEPVRRRDTTTSRRRRSATTTTIFRSRTLLLTEGAGAPVVHFPAAGAFCGHRRGSPPCGPAAGRRPAKPGPANGLRAAFGHRRANEPRGGLRRPGMRSDHHLRVTCLRTHRTPVSGETTPSGAIR